MRGGLCHCNGRIHLQSPTFPPPPPSSQSVGGLNILRHPKLRDLTGLGSLGTIHGSLVALGCASLTSLAGLGSTAAAEAVRTGSVPSSRHSGSIGTEGGGGGGGTAASSMDAMRAALSSRGLLEAPMSVAGQAVQAVPTAGPLVAIGSSLWVQSNPELISLQGLEVRCMCIWGEGCVEVGGRRSAFEEVRKGGGVMTGDEEVAVVVWVDSATLLSANCGAPPILLYYRPA